MDTRYCLHPVVINENTIYPCGKCPVCRMKYRKQMALRIYMEKSIEKPIYSYFLTLTYDEQHIPSVLGRPCFSKKHITTFLDSLRHRIREDGYSLRYFLTCEYGEKGYRPHYHALLFLYPIPGLVQRRYPRLVPGKNFPHTYFAECIAQPLWNKGFCYEGTVTPQSCMYCTSYALKDDEELNKDWTGFEEGKPFRRYSLKPGLGLTDDCMSWWLDYILNDRKDIRNSIRIQFKTSSEDGKPKYLRTGIPDGVKRKMAINYIDEYELLLDRNLESFAETMNDLKENCIRYGASKVYRQEAGGTHHLENPDFEPDKFIISFRKALRKMNKNRKSL